MDILKAHASGSLHAYLNNKEFDDGVKLTLKYALHPHITFGVTTPELTDESSPLGQTDFHLLDRLAARELTGLAAIAAVYEKAKNNKLFSAVVNKALRIGLGPATVNKYYPGLIPSFSQEKAKPYKAGMDLRGYSMEVKLDGARITTIVSGSEVTFLTSGGLPIELPHIKKTLLYIKDGMYDGELIFDKGSVIDRPKINGMITSLVASNKKGLPAYLPEPDRISLVLFDYLTPKEMSAQRSQASLMSRRLALKEYLGAIGIREEFTPGEIPSGNVCLYHELGTVYSESDIDSAFYALTDKGFEGLVMKPMSSIYTFKRACWIKRKNVKDADLLCVGVEEGEGLREGMIGALICEGTVEGVKVKVKVAGLSEADWTKPAEYYIGEIIEILYESVSVNNSLTLPRFSRVRHDKRKA